MLNFGITAPTPFFIAVPNVVDVQEPPTSAQPRSRQIPPSDFRRHRRECSRCWEVAEHELIALLGDRRRRGNVMTKGMPFCSATWAMALL
jgi:hypothetical protein